MKIDAVQTPMVIIIDSILRKNIIDMSIRSQQKKIKLRPHIKTHNLPAITTQQLKAGTSGATVATINEAKQVAALGCNDIFIAREMTDAAELDILAELLKNIKNISLSVAIDSIEGMNILNKIMKKHELTIPVRVEINSGGNRCGISNFTELRKLVDRIQDSHLTLQGIFTHEGHIYKSGSRENMRTDSENVVKKMHTFSEFLQNNKFYCKEISIGSSPSIKLIEDFSGITEIRPGNYVFNDLMQITNGSSKVEDCALRIIASVISKPDDNRTILNVGTKLLGSDSLKLNEKLTVFGAIISTNSQYFLTRIYEEHSIIETPNPLKIGQRVIFIPVHACMVANIARKLLLIGNDMKNIITSYEHSWI